MNSRNIGVDLLRGLAAFMVVILHCLSFTGCLDLKTSYINFHVYYLVNCFAFCAVNIFGLISGYIGYTSEKKEEYHLSRILHLYITVLSYSLGILALYCIKNNVFIFSRGHIKYFTPFLSETWWYLTDYVAVFFFMPYINALLNTLGKEMAKRMLYLIVILFSICSIIARFLGNESFFGVKGGYSMVWLLSLYYYGAYFKKYGFPKLIERYPIRIYCAVSIFSWLGYEFIRFMLEKWGVDVTGRLYLLYYVSIPVLLQGVTLLCFFSREREAFRTEGVIGDISKLMAMTSFGVFIAHTHPLAKGILFKRFFPQDYANSSLGIVKVLGYAIVLYLLCFCVEYGRNRIYRKVLLRRKK